jgi:hypothetical protein
MSTISHKNSFFVNKMMIILINQRKILLFLLSQRIWRNRSDIMIDSTGRIVISQSFQQ